MSLAWAAVAGMIVYLDTTAVAQIMICQPIIACPLWGWLAGRWDIGVLLGIVFQMLWSGSLPVGAARFPEGNVGALVATALAVSATEAGGTDWPWHLIAMAVLTGVVMAYAGASVTAGVRQVMTRHAERVVAAAVSGSGSKFAMLFCGAVGIHALAGLLLTAVGLGVGYAAIQAVRNAPSPLFLRYLMPAMLGAGAAVVASRFVRRTNWSWFAAALALAMGGGWLWN